MPGGTYSQGEPASVHHTLMSEAEMRALFPDHPEAIDNTWKIAEMCDLDLSFKGYHLPEFPRPAEFETAHYARSQSASEAGVR